MDGKNITDNNKKKAVEKALLVLLAFLDESGVDSTIFKMDSPGYSLSIAIGVTERVNKNGGGGNTTIH